MQITLNIVTCIKMAADALQLLAPVSHLFIIQVRLRSLTCQQRRKKVLMTFNAADVIYML